MQKWIPDRKVLTGGLAGVAAWLLLAALAHYGVDPQPVINGIFALVGQPAPAAQPLLAGVIGWAVAYWVPPAEKDIVKRIDDELARLAGYLPASQRPGMSEPTGPIRGPIP